MKKSERGAYLVMMALLLAVLIGVAALAIDVGRLLVMRTEMQNAVDAAALAAAAELDGETGARNRAIAAARDLLEHDARFDKVVGLLDKDSLPAKAFEFFCVIGNTFDADPGQPGFTSYCSGANVEPGKYSASNDEESHYVRVTMSPDLVEGEQFTSDLIFLPVLRLIGVDAVDSVSMSAAALAGRNFFTCDYPPMMMCDPWEGSSNFRAEVTAGQSIHLFHQPPDSWAPGNFGFLAAEGTGKKDLKEYLADPSGLGCNPAVIKTEPGVAAQPARRAINTRFAMYEGGFKNSDYSAAPNIGSYPPDIAEVKPRVGNGQWSIVDYWAAAHPDHPDDIPNGWNDGNPPLRWEVYNHELSGEPPDLPEGGDPDSDANPNIGEASRRLINVAVLSCEGIDEEAGSGPVKGRVTRSVFPEDGFAQMFILDPADKPGSDDGLSFHVEFIKWVDGKDDDYHVQIQLYE